MNYSLILAAGRGQRMKTQQDKLLLQVGGKPLVYHSLVAFNDHPEIEGIILVVNKDNKFEMERLVKKYHFPKVRKIIIGGETRQKSFAKAFEALPKNLKKEDVIIVHNGDNPCVSQEEIEKVIKESRENGACIVGHYVTSTIKEVDDKHILKTHDRDKLFAAETPQAATYSLFAKALEHAKKKKLEVTDEAMLLESIGQNV
ncbi:2-C-methyl-D-erythritol 4-phosphate cytidylyltransferase, partial [Candidatus Gracilibacteria bacterium]|nr:2-C-methyl-D-erythritol 4-phosphate cytidylyltransferase [Candidatus Gracilibacteria bacterium]